MNRNSIKSESEKIVLLFTTDNWKTSSSRQLRAIFSGINSALNCKTILIQLIENNVIEKNDIEGWFYDVYADDWKEQVYAMSLDELSQLDTVYIHQGYNGECEVNGGFL